ncbi:ABC transporter permease [Thermomonospora cellulosilytica]|uniref:Peptide/nickel transport system permease protein n=1 Tax=Thermomonospora cellulosilytica TaxID=1411118 RepID=A0A7W3R6P5_9ACTN|nr:ABC transporter permease [Thermomonospora cellulosilytica]MBA9001560.1 peptide/nickel transport system permease protein [Thermomonospora cellulosilytica]
MRARALRRMALVRLAVAVPLLPAVSVAVFLLGAASPFDPVYQYYGTRIFTAAEADVARTREALGLDEPVWRQYLDWLHGAVTGDWGVSRSFGQPVAEVVAQRLPWTLLLAGAGLTLAVLIALALGVTAAWRPGGWADRAVVAVAHSLEGLPTFLLGLGAIAVFAVALPLLPAGGASDGGVVPTLRHLALPALVLAIAQLPWLILTLRQQLLVSLADDHVTAARARGLPERTVVLRHGLPVALLPFVTTVGTRLPELVTGVVLVEEVFSWPGVAGAMVEAGLNVDYPLLVALTLLATAAVLAGNLLADMAVALIDPRTVRG